MRFTVAATAAFVAGASATYGRASSSEDVVYTTKVVKDYTTYCPEATKVTHGGQTYTVTEATTLTITDCSCTITYPKTTSPATSAPVYTTTSASQPPVYTTTSASQPPVYTTTSATTVAPVPSSYSSKVETHPAPSSTTVAPVPTTTPAAPSTYAPTTYAPVPTTYPAGNATKPVSPTGSATKPITTFTGAANKVAGAGIAAIFGLAALAL